MTDNRGHRARLAGFTATIFLSALLLFSVQPMIAKMVLPIFGGAPATWAVSLCFFQALLLLGYGYAHVLARADRRVALAVHIAVLLLALAALPVALPSAWSAPPPGNAYLWLMGLLAVSIGAPFFALSANAPLLQAWFARLGHARSANPYFLYAASNAGSLAALLAYPFAIEPLLALRVQSRVWSAGFVLLALLIATCGGLMLASRRSVSADVPGAPAGAEAAAPISWRRRALWAFLAFVPSGLLVAFTTFLTTDLASAPLLWVVPLALFLATFIVVFRERPLVSHRVMLALQPAAIGAVLAASEWTGSLSWVAACLAGVLAFGIVSLVCHGELYRLRPAPERLTEFYLWMSLGGVLGGAFAALIAPLLFTNVLEFPLLLVVSMLCRSCLWRHIASTRDRLELAVLIGGAVVLIVLIDRLATWGILPPTPGLRLYALVSLALATIAAARWPRVQLAFAALMVMGVAALPHANAPVHVTRNFFGTHRVVDSIGGEYRVLLHGTTLHGLQHNTPAALARRPVPLAYYHSSGPLARGLGLARPAGGGPRAALRVGVIGLGTGALACYAQPGDRWRFFEIDPAVVQIATTPAYFRYLSACMPEPDIVLGDARLTLAREPAGAFDYLVIDAFSSDSIPVHLLTVEAFRLYLARLSDRGILALHISNQNLDLPPVVEANVAALGLKGVYAEGVLGQGALPSQVILVSRNEQNLAPALDWHKARRLGAPSVRAWTDDYSDILSAMIRRVRSKLAQTTAP